MRIDIRRLNSGAADFEAQIAALQVPMEVIDPSLVDTVSEIIATVRSRGDAALLNRAKTHVRGLDLGVEIGRDRNRQLQQGGFTVFRTQHQVVIRASRRIRQGQEVVKLSEVARVIPAKLKARARAGLRVSDLC